MPHAAAGTDTVGWHVLLEIPAVLIEALYGLTLEHGRRFRGNFYACGDKTPAPYYAAWNEVETPSPDFHRPEFFGEFTLA